ncbi:uncharacterized protein LOC118437816 [Folsomia candida]|uniref:uncharacterized protein LOC118437816 n=1 Tax=Folsomia candida TaxID=158441 RepID=UPI001604DCAB|nr:uncharacterized protein LOC118437816 [Folsomia candida]
MILRLITILCILKSTTPTYSSESGVPHDVQLTQPNKRMDPIPVVARNLQLGPAYAPPAVKQCSQRASTPDATFSRSCYDPKVQSGHDVCKFYIEGAIYTGKDPYQAGCPSGTVGYCCCDPKIGTCENIV